MVVNVDSARRGFLLARRDSVRNLEPYFSSAKLWANKQLLEVEAAGYDACDGVNCLIRAEIHRGSHVDFFDLSGGHRLTEPREEQLRHLLAEPVVGQA